MRISTFAGVSVLALALSALGGGAAFAAGAKTSDAPADVGEIVVTAQHETSLLSKTPIAMSAVTGSTLRDVGVTNPTNLQDVVPNISLIRGNGLQITIRGVTSTDGTEKGDPSAAFLEDGVYIARPQDQEVSFFDLERVEVLRGPQGTLYGRNTTAGVINLITNSPKHRFEASADGAYGNFNTVNLTGMVNIPVNNQIALRAALNYDRRDSYIYKASGTPYSLSPFKDNLSGRLSALFDVNSNINVLLRADYTKVTGADTNAVPLTNFFPSFTNSTGAIVTDAEPAYREISNPRFTSFPEAIQTRRDDDTWGVMGQLNWNLGPVVATYIGSYRQSHRNELLSVDAGLNPATFNAHYWQNSQELRFAFGQGQKLHGQFGGYYFKEQSGIFFFIQNPQNLGFPPGVSQFGFPQDPTIERNLAGFGQVTYDLASNLHVTGGVRYSNDEKSRVGATVFDFTSGPRITLQINNAKRTFSKVTWRGGVDYDLPNLGLIYASIATGYKAGGFNDGCEIGTGPACALPAAALYYQPETLTAYEGGFKFKLFDSRVRFSAAAFHYEYSGLQLSSVSNVCGGPCQVTTNAAHAKVDGVELESIFHFDEHNRIDLGLNVLDARYAQYLPTPTVSWSGKKLDRAPAMTFNAGYTYTYPLANGGKIEAGGVIRFSDSYVLSDFTNRDQFRQPSYHKSDLTLTYDAPEGRWYVQAFAKNLENVIALTSASPTLGSSASFADPRTFGVRAGAKF